jgi:hypothetical protein
VRNLISRIAHNEHFPIRTESEKSSLKALQNNDRKVYHSYLADSRRSFDGIFKQQLQTALQKLKISPAQWMTLEKELMSDKDLAQKVKQAD